MSLLKKISVATATLFFFASSFITGGPIAHAAGLYTFTSFTFTNAGVTGRTGPTLTKLLTTYDTATNSWLKNSAYLSVGLTGIQVWTVPETGDYQITAAGAQGAPATSTSGGLGAVMQGTFSLTQGQKLQILVGQTAAGAPSRIGMSSPGGGGSFVVRNGGTTIADIVIIAGGGGGTSNIARAANSNAVADSITARSSSSGAAGGSNGNNGTNGGTSSGAGGGFLTGGSGYNEMGTSFISGGLGGDIASGWSNEGGGFGSGGSVTNGAYDRYAGGGGFNGGGSSNLSGNSNPSDTAYGGGGSSYNLGRNQSNTVSNQGSGYVRIERVFTPSSMSLSVPANMKYGEKISLVASTSVDGTVTFFARGKRIPNCINLKTSSQSVTCQYKVATRNVVELTATFSPNDSSVAKASAAPQQAKPGNRTSTR